MLDGAAVIALAIFCAFVIAPAFVVLVIGMGISWPVMGCAGFAVCRPAKRDTVKRPAAPTAMIPDVIIVRVDMCDLLSSPLRTIPRRGYGAATAVGR